MECLLGQILEDVDDVVLDLEVLDVEVLEVEVNSEDRDRIIEQLTGCEFDFMDAGDTIQVFHTNGEELTRELGDCTERLEKRPATLEDVFFRLTGRTLVE